jgi:prevent-host-death family protein
MERIGVRELRQHASRYLARVRAGETIEVTDRGRAVARLVPIRGSSWEDLIDAGVVNRPDNPDFDLGSWAPLDVEPGGPTASERLERDRDDRR